MREYSYRKLRGRIVEKYGYIAEFAKEIGTTRVTASNKLNCHSGFSQDDMETWGNALDIPVDQYGEYFFT